MKQKKNQANGIQINSAHSINIGGDLIGRDKIIKTTYSYFPSSPIDLSPWQEMMSNKIEKEGFSTEKKKELEKQIELIKASIEKNKIKNIRKSENLISTLALMSKDIFDVAITTLVNPLAGIGLVLKKIGDKAKIEVMAK